MIKTTKLLDELREILETSSSVPLTSKVMIDSVEVSQIIDEIEESLPDEIKQARWIEAEKDRILTEAREEYATVVKEAQRQADALVEKDAILVKSKERAEQVMHSTNASVRKLKLSTYDYVDKILFDFQEKMDDLSEMYNKMYKHLENTFADIEDEIEKNRGEIQEMAFRTNQEARDGER
ncbi:MAG: hypothetical protein PUI85_03620 [Eubacteriales bacterium]|nr:hypothetical protein [Eubacteriales bacterium]MDY3332248.1 hypothetical protein [Gallibacter sp.]